jgi:hypothetical protein
MEAVLQVHADSQPLIVDTHAKMSDVEMALVPPLRGIAGGTRVRDAGHDPPSPPAIC